MPVAYVLRNLLFVLMVVGVAGLAVAAGNNYDKSVRLSTCNATLKLEYGVTSKLVGHTPSNKVLYEDYSCEITESGKVIEITSISKVVEDGGSFQWLSNTSTTQYFKL